jgi:GNAT superfamily N-acetyltransferase
VDLPATAALLGGVFPGSDVSRLEYLRWLYADSPFGEVIEANLDDEAGRAGHYALVPVALTRDGVPISGALSLNTAVHERARGGGTFVRLASEAIELATRGGIRALVGVANANSTPGFLRRLDFELLGPLPASVLVPRPGGAGGLRSGWSDPSAFAAGGLAAGSGELMSVPARGEARLWDERTLAWRLERPGGRYALHRSQQLLAVSLLARRRGMRVAVLLKIFSRRPLEAGVQHALVRVACRFHRAPLALHVGFNRHVSFRGVALPERLRDSPLNLIYRSLEQSPRPGSVVDFEFLDFDAY